MNDKMFNYCERGLDPGPLAEPVNAVTNAAFVIAGLAALYLIRLRPPGKRSVVHTVLAVLVMCIGVGSFLFHTHATAWAAIADVAPIGVFMLLYFGVAMRSLLRLPTGLTITLTAAFAACLWAAARITCGADGGRCLNGSVRYLPALAAMLAIGGILALKRHPAARSLLVAAGIFALSVTFRTLDQALCAETVIAGAPLGTHFLWHLLNALMLFILMRAVMTNGRTTLRTGTPSSERNRG